MQKEVLFGLLILCGIVSQGICTLSEANEKSSDLHIRTKRLVGNPTHIVESLFLVNIVANGVNHCPATLLTSNAVITSMQCLKKPNTRWNLRTSSSVHEFVRVVPYQTYNELHPTMNNLALVFFHPSLNYHTTHNRPIQIYRGNLAGANDNPIIFNWDHEEVAPGIRRQSASELSAVSLQFISIGYCQQYYPNRIVNENICTQSLRKGHYCQHFDSGSPLIIQQQLIGIFAYRGQACATDPDVFMNLLDPQIRLWIHQHIPSLRLF